MKLRKSAPDPFARVHGWLDRLSKDFPNSVLDLRPSDIGDLYHVYGVNADYPKFKAMLLRRNRISA